MKKVLRVCHVRAINVVPGVQAKAIAALGLVPTTGWRNGQLIPYQYPIPPTDGIWDFDFVADEPGGIAAQVIQPVAAISLWSEQDGVPKGIRVHASQNCIEVLFAQMLASDVMKMSQE